MAYEINPSPLFRPIIDTNGHHFCGPRSITSITGVPISRVEKMIKRMRKSKSPVKGTYVWEVLKCLKRLGCRVEEMKTFESTLGRFRDDLEPTPHTYLVEVTGHWTVVRKGEKRDATSDLKRVVRAWIVKAPANPKYTTGAPLPTKHRIKVERELGLRPPKPDIKTVRARKLAAQIKEWESKMRRAENALKKLRPKLRRYERLAIIPATI